MEIADPAWTHGLEPSASLAQTAAAAALAASGQADGGEIAVLLTDDATVADLNQRFRGRAGPTNVLSFPAVVGSGRLGDIALAYGVCAREAEAQDKRLADHLQHLVAHGVLHLLGYDHAHETEAEEMENLERVILARLGVADPYGGERDAHG